MKTKNLLKVALFAIVAISMVACKSASIIPQARSTVNSISFSDLNLERGDYSIMNTITAEATIKYTQKANGVDIEAVGGDFTLEFEEKEVKNGGWMGMGKSEKQLLLDKFSGVVRLGYLTNDDADGEITYLQNPEDLGRRLAIYRLINMAKEQGADGVIEPLVSTNVEQVGRKTIMFTTTVSAKCVKIKVK